MLNNLQVGIYTFFVDARLQCLFDCITASSSLFRPRQKKPRNGCHIPEVT
jgi:hypothetical protein